MSILQTIVNWVESVCELVDPPSWIDTFITALSVSILVTCIIGLIWLVFSVLHWIFTFGGR